MQNLIKSTLVLILIGFFSCVNKRTEIPEAESTYHEMHRPEFHFTPAHNWMNDPNGMVYYEGEYHLFYQHYPDSNVWGPMHWGHAVSKDLIHWENLPIALYPDSLGYIFSGSAVIDHNNTSGLGSPDHPVMVAIFTYHSVEGERAGKNDFQNQGIAYSVDKGRTWKKYDGNPVLKNTGKRDFRDPKVFWHQASAQWIMVLAVKDHVEFFGSKNLKDWNHLSDFGLTAGAHGGVWECPDLFELTVSGSTEKKWVLIVNINPGAYNGGSGTQYFTGHFDGKEFHPDTEEIRWIDYGKDNYAGVTWSNVPESDGRRLFMGWMSNWQYANIVPTYVWRNAATVPRELSLVQTTKGLRIASNPVSEVGVLKEGKGISYSDVVSLTDTVSKEIDLPKSTVELIVEIERNDEQSSFEIEISNTKGERILIGLDGDLNQFYVDRNHSGKVDFSKDFGGKHIGVRSFNDKDIKLTLLLDVASVELFADKGTLVMTEIFFPTENYNQLKIRAKQKGVNVKSVQLTPLKSIW